MRLQSLLSLALSCPHSTGTIGSAYSKAHTEALARLPLQFALNLLTRKHESPFSFSVFFTYLFQQLNNVKCVVQAMEKATAVRGNAAFHFSDSLTYPNSTEEKARFLCALPTRTSTVAQNKEFNKGFAGIAQSQFFWKIFPFCLVCGRSAQPGSLILVRPPGCRACLEIWPEEWSTRFYLLFWKYYQSDLRRV